MNAKSLINLMLGILFGALTFVVGCQGGTAVGVVNPGVGGTPDAPADAATYPGTGGSSPGTGGSLVSGTGGETGTGGATGNCPQAGVNNTPTTVAALRASLARTWLLCSPLGLTHQPQDGLVITTDDRYAVLRRDPTGVLVAQRGVDFEGSVTFIEINPDFGGGIQTNFTSDLGGTVISRPVITTNPTMLIINNNGVYEYRYVAADGQ